MCEAKFSIDFGLRQRKDFEKIPDHNLALQKLRSYAIKKNIVHEPFTIYPHFKPEKRKH